MPLVEEKPQVDLLAEREADMAAARELLVDAGLLVHGRRVARECEQRAAQLERLQQLDPWPAQRRGLQRPLVGANMRGDRLALADAERLGRVLVAPAFGAQGREALANLIGIHRVCFLFLLHQKSATSDTLT
jgi:hypothetical protein